MSHQQNIGRDGLDQAASESVVTARLRPKSRDRDVPS